MELEKRLTKVSHSSGRSTKEEEEEAEKRKEANKDLVDDDGQRCIYVYLFKIVRCMCCIKIREKSYKGVPGRKPEQTTKELKRTTH
jgi:hypothetical protein